jgi:heterogeneous nuclear ribonucleoprotein A1/A3
MDKKIFVHGLGSELTEQMLHEQFEKYGEVEEVNVVMDKHSNRSKGYGFVTFKDVASMMRALEYPEKQVNVSPVRWLLM